MNRLISTIAGAVTLFALASACDNPAKDKAKLGVADTASAAAPAAPTAAAGVRYTFDAQSSKVSWIGSKVTGSHDGGFETFSGTIDLVDGKPQLSAVSVDIDAKSIESDTPKLTKHLKSADFFDTEKYPKITFTSTTITPTGGDGKYQITGNLDLRGVTKAVTFPATVKISGATVETEAEFSFNRRDFGINYDGMANDLIRDDVVVRLKIKSHRAGS
jgi:polyisoprenoid-binding protein YceI